MPLLMCLFCSFRSSFQNSACSFQKQRNCRYSNFPYFSGFLRCNRQKSLKYQAFRQIQSRLKPPSKITKQPLTYKTRNRLIRKGPWVQIRFCYFALLGYIFPAAPEIILYHTPGIFSTLQTQRQCRCPALPLCFVFLFRNKHQPLLLAMA